MILLQLQRQSIQVAKINNNQFHFSTFQKGWWKILIRQNNLRTARNINYKTNTQLYLMGSCRSDKAVGWIHYPLTRKWSHGVNATQGRLHLSKGNGRIYEPNLFHPSGFIERKKKKKATLPGFLLLSITSSLSYSPSDNVRVRGEYTTALWRASSHAT